MKLLSLFVLLVVPLAAAQEAPSDSDYGSTDPPQDDASYMNDNGTPANATDDPDGAISDSDFDTSVPADDASYLADEGIPAPVGDATGTTDETPPAGTPSTTPGQPGTKTPGLGLVAVLAIGGLAALALGRRY